ncbi:cytochrome oxidase assembly protein ShyY1 [Prauserella shujinwangii]|uniref:SURF1-like protein n=1 Tax=Prauserella shujinwangii TaxID=1453103 RepID=A0A2T0LM67_9PSEU|nr:SURF1 family cytochrome oxidase biogenesis protein [Prauserella shujinwangii]PRX44169.1 cytochrome oxidase assembly protein ShyY1 [Prauserella shujinwangii]
MRWKFLLRPGWLALTLVVFVFATACYTLLAPWQFHRDDERQARNAALTESFTAPPRPLDRVLPAGQAPGQRTEWTRVELRGTYLPEHEVIARLRTVQGEPAFEVLTPLRTTDGQLVLVDRGYVRPDDHTRVPPYAAPPEGQVRVEARVRQDEVDPQGRPAFANASTQGRLHSYVVSSSVVGAATGLDLRPGYFQLAEGQPGVLGALPLPKLDAGPYFSYALQWIAFGSMTLFAWLYFTIRELKPGGVLSGDRPKPERRKSVAEILAEDERREAGLDGARRG